jgi:hypothetical protein
MLLRGKNGSLCGAAVTTEAEKTRTAARKSDRVIMINNK